MTNAGSRSITPDCTTGAIFAMEGIRNAVVLLNGPMGCRFYHSTTSRFLTIRPLLRLPQEEGGEARPVDYNTLNNWFFRQERVPCTWLDGEDYVYGTREKVLEALAYIRDHVAFDLLAIVNSPGASLIGDALLEPARGLLGDQVILLETPGWSSAWEDGASAASLQVLKGLRLRKDREIPGRVNLLGVNLWQRYQEGDVLELKRLLALCGVETGAVLCAGTSVPELERLPEAELNLVVCPELGMDCAKYLEETWGTPYLCPDLPVGFDATEAWIDQVCGRLGKDPAPALEESRRARALAWYKLRDFEQSYGRPRGVKFHVEIGPSADRAYTAFLRDYLAMIPSPAREAELVFSDANVIAELMLENRTFCGIEARMPSMGYTDLLPKTHLGVNGALFLIEQVLNGLMSKI